MRQPRRCFPSSGAPSSPSSAVDVSPPVGLQLDSDSSDAIEEFLARTYAVSRIGGGVGQVHRAKISRSGADPLTVDRFDIGFRMGYEVEPLRRLAICSMHTGTLHDHGTGAVFGPGSAFALAPPDQDYAGHVDDASYTIALLDPHLLNRVAAASGSQAGPVKLLSQRPYDAAAARLLDRTLAYADSILTDAAAQRAPLVTSSVYQLLAVTVLNAFPTTAGLEPAAADRRDAHPDTLRRAVGFVDSHAHTDISLADIAAAAHVTTRTLQHVFRRHLQTTPTGYLRTVRLAAAHQDLRAGDPTTTTVTQIAHQWGFTHPGRFAAAYQQSYHRPPAATLRS